jgi:hypothetical protein
MKRAQIPWGQRDLTFHKKVCCHHRAMKFLNMKRSMLREKSYSTIDFIGFYANFVLKL